MPTANLTDLYDYVLPDLPSVPQALALHHIRLAAAEFFERSKIWYYDHPLIDVVTGTAEYAFTPPAGSEVCAIRQAWYNNQKIYARSPITLNESYEDWRSEVGVPYWYLRMSRLSVRLVPNPSADLVGGLKLWVNLKPTKDATTIEEEHFHEWGEAIAAGAKYRLAIIPKKPYTNTDMAAVWFQQFKDGYNLALQRANNGMVEDESITITLA